MITVDREKCLDCGSCARVCPRGVMSYDGAHLTVRGDRPCLGCMHCTAACPVQAIHLDSVPAQLEYPPREDDELRRLMTERRSVRHYRAELPPRETVERAIHTTAWAPSGKNVHKTGFTVVWGAEQTERIFDLTMELCSPEATADISRAMERGVNLLTCSAPCVIVGWAPEDAPSPDVDTAIAMTMIELQLVREGLSTCWGGFLTGLANCTPALADALGVPEGCRVYCALMVGYADGERFCGLPYRAEPQTHWIG